MLVVVNLPLSLALEVYTIVGYILNRTLTRLLGWKTPFKITYKRKPLITYMHIYGYKAYVLRTKITRGDKLTERALVGHLVGYNSINIYRI
jgi:hypothetical protein